MIINEIHFYYYVMVLEDGKRIPWVKIHNDDNSVLIEHLFTMEFRLKENVDNLICQLENVESKEFVYHSNLELHLEKEVVYIEEDSTRAMSFTTSTNMFLEILKGWYEFLLKYDSDRIPGLLPLEKLNEERLKRN